MFLRGLKSTQKSIHDTEAETEKEEEVRFKFFIPGRFWVTFGSCQLRVKKTGRDRVKNVGTNSGIFHSLRNCTK